MGVNFSDSLTSSGKAFQKMLKELADLEVRVGFQKGDDVEKGVDICDVAAWNELGNEHIPSRPFLRKSWDENKDKINNLLTEQQQLLMGGTPSEKVLKNIGLFQKDLIQEKISEGSYEPNAKSTIKKKGSAKPLIDTGRMRQSVNYVIKKKGEGGD